MGGEQSQELPDSRLYNAILKSGQARDATFWTQLLALAPPRGQRFVPDPVLLNEIATK